MTDDNDARIQNLHMQDGQCDAIITMPGTVEIAAEIAREFFTAGGVNYVSLGLYHDDTGPLELIVQRKQGKTPTELNAELQARVAELEAQLQATRDQADVSAVEVFDKADLVIFAAHGTNAGVAVRDADIPKAAQHIAEHGTPTSMPAERVAALLASVADYEFRVDTVTAWALPEGSVLAVTFEEDDSRDWLPCGLCGTVVYALADGVVYCDACASKMDATTDTTEEPTDAE